MSEHSAIVQVRTMEPKWRKIKKRDKWVSAGTRTFVGAMSGQPAKFGIGLLDEQGDAIFWGEAVPHRLITAWRAMWVLERMSRVDLETVKACYHCMECYRMRDSTLFVRDDEKWLQLLGKQYSGMEVLQASLANVPISHIELDRMLEVCNDSRNGICVSITELEQELRARTIERTPEVERVFAIAADDAEKCRRAEAMTTGRLLGHQSFQKFCEDLGVINLCDEPQGAYGCDWGHCDYGALDRDLVYNGMLSGYVREVYCSRNAAESRDFGQIGHPVFSTCTGRHVALMRVKFDDMGMQVRLKDLEESETEEWMSLAQARRLVSKMIGITCEPFAAVSDHDRQRGYVSVSAGRKLVQYYSKGR